MVKHMAAIAFLGVTAWIGAAYARDDAKPDDGKDDQLKLLKLDMTQRELVQVEADIRKMTVEMNFWNARGGKVVNIPVPNSAIDERIGQDSLITRRQADIARLREDLVLARTKISAKNSSVVERLTAEITAAEKDVETLKHALRAQIADQLRERAKDEFAGKLTQYQEQLSLLAELEKVLRKDVQTLTAETQKLRSSNDKRIAQIEAELRELKAEIARLKKGT